MAGNHLGDGATASAGPKAFLLRGNSVSPEEEKLARLLDALGVPWKAVPAGDIAGDSTHPSKQVCIVISANCLSALLGLAADDRSELPDWIRRARSVYVYGFAEGPESQNLLRFLTGDAESRVRSLTSRHASILVAADFPELCGPMTGLRFTATTPERETVFECSERNGCVRRIVQCDGAQLFIACERQGARIFLNSTTHIVDVLTTCRQFFEVKDNFCETVPLVMWARWAFGLGSPTEISGCLIVDDPPLKPRYGFLNYQDNLRAMDQHNFATTIAFIPWNWSRTEGRTVQLFHERPERFSLCVHGCDHTEKEFAEESPVVLNKRLGVAKRRMQLLKQRTRLPHDEVMVFPQGAFSASAIRALKMNGFMAAVNTEVAPRNGDNKTTVGDLLGMAIMKYASFPVFTRRYVFHGVENFAFDGLLGKPCLIAAHHDDFMHNSRQLLELIAQLNALNWNLHWRPLGDTIRRAFKTREDSDGNQCVEMYGTNLGYLNSRESAERMKFIKNENDFESVKTVTVNGQSVDYLHQDGHLQFEATIPAKETAELRVVYSHEGDLASSPGDLSYQLKALVRRYLSEFRDNYLSRNANLQQSAVKLKQALRL